MAPPHDAEALGVDVVIPTGFALRTADRVVVVGNGNVALDVARIARAL